MLKDKTNRKLLVVLVVLAVVYAGSYWLKKGSAGSQVLTTDLVHIDTAQITKIEIEKPGSQIQLTREGYEWMLTTEENVQVDAEENRIRSMISSLSRLVPSRVVSRDPDKWRDYQVDSTGQRVRVYEGENQTLDLIIGRGSMQGQRTFITYVRPYLEDNVYVIENFSGSSVSANSSNYRNKEVLTTTVDSIRQLRFDYPGEQGFTLSKVDDEWKLNDADVDSAQTVDFLKELRRISSSSFVDQQHPAASATPSSSLIIRSNGEEDILLHLFDGPDGGQILHSSQNPDNYFADTAVINKVFVDRETFLP